MHVIKFSDRFQFYYYLVITNEIRNKLRMKLYSSVIDMQGRLTLKRYSYGLELLFKSLLIDLFCKSTTKITMDSHSCTNYLVCQFCVFVFGHIVCRICEILK